jgi:hypothetical protein
MLDDQGKKRSDLSAIAFADFHLLASAPKRYYIARCVKLAEADSQVQIVLSDDVYCNMVCRVQFAPRHRGRAAHSRSLCFLASLPAFFVRFRDEDRGARFCGKFSLQDPYVVIRSALRGKFRYLHEPLVYTRTHAGSQTSKMVRVEDAVHLRL